jgi:hypothetical protein
MSCWQWVTGWLTSGACLAAEGLSVSERLKLMRTKVQLNASFGRCWRLLGLAEDTPPQCRRAARRAGVDHMPTLKTQGGEAGTLTFDQECLLLHGRTFFGGWQKALEDAAWLQTAEARAAWRRHRARLIREWLRTMPRELPAASRLYDTPQQRRELSHAAQGVGQVRAAQARPAEAGGRGDAQGRLCAVRRGACMELGNHVWRYPDPARGR